MEFVEKERELLPQLWNDKNDNSRKNYGGKMLVHRIIAIVGFESASFFSNN